MALNIVKPAELPAWLQKIKWKLDSHQNPDELNWN